MATSAWNNLLKEAHAWHLSPDELSPLALERHCLGWLSSDEQAHRPRLATDQLRHEHLAARALCRAALSRFADVDPAKWEFIKTANGKPEIAGPVEFKSLRFNLTHTGGLVVCLVTRMGEVGIDAEEISRRVDVDEIARHFFSPAERAHLHELPSEHRAEKFFEYWVLKEAYLKGRGAGLSVSPESFTMEWDDVGKPLTADGWQLSLHRPTPRHVAAIALPVRRGVEISIRWNAMAHPW